MPDTFVCAMCEEEFIKGRSDAESLEELKEIWGDVSPDDCDQVCDDCWEKVKPANNQDFFDDWQATSKAHRVIHYANFMTDGIPPCKVQSYIYSTLTWGNVTCKGCLKYSPEKKRS